jgi:hypothetical protein
MRRDDPAGLGRADRSIFPNRAAAANQESRGEKEAMARSMFDRYGGFANLSKVVMAFYDKVLDSEIIGDYFEYVDMRRLIDPALLKETLEDFDIERQDVDQIVAAVTSRRPYIVNDQSR